MKKIKITKDFFKNIDFKVAVSPFGEKKCCCGHINCVDVDCLMHAIETDVLTDKK